mmetsp:Transcript_120585/g.286460  ORF Transcript_120585/g.286460 Transcript_120585/m.286460 type:complete len:301 (-) Transcript_120585:151-1053(-)
MTRDDVVLVLGIQRPHDGFQLFRQLVALQLRWVVQAVHHAGDAAVLQGLGDRLPAVLNQLRRVAGIDAIGHHLLEAQDCACLQHTAENGLLAHEVTLDLGHEGAQQHSRTVAAGRGGIGLGDVQSISLRIVLRMHGNQSGDAEAALVLLTYLGARALWRNHDHCQVRPDLHALLDDVKSMAVGQSGALLHHGHHSGDHGGVLLVRGEVADEVCLGDQLFVCADLEAVLRSVDKALTLLVDGILPQGIAHVAAGVAHVKALVQALRAAADDDNLLLVQLEHAVRKLRSRHEPTSAQLVELL